MYNKKSVTIAYIDFSRAIDSISHDKLFQRLHAYGIRGSVLSWLKTTSVTEHTRQGLDSTYRL